MSLRAKFIETVTTTLAPDETIIAVQLAGLPFDYAKGMAQSLAKSVAVSLITAPLTGYSAVYTKVPVTVYVAITNRRLVINRVQITTKAGIKVKQVGELIIDAPLGALRLKWSTGLMKRLTVSDTAENHIITIGFGARQIAYRNMKKATDSI